MSPEVIVVATPDILVIQVEASGGYSQLDWQTPPSSSLGYFADFDETYIQEGTSDADLGVYRVNALAQGLVLPPLPVEFTVTPYSEWLVVIGNVTIISYTSFCVHHIGKHLCID